MKEKLIYILSFALAFALVTGALIYLNTHFKNIFAFDFTRVGANDKPEVASLVEMPTDTTKQDALPAPVAVPKNQNMAAKTDTATVVKKDTTSTAKKNTAIAKIQQVEPQKALPTTPQQESPKVVATREFQKTMKDSAYESWIKKTVKLYEEMDAKKAAKVILGYSDNIARDLLFSMKKRKAAEILTEFKPEVATRIINFN